jgi:hypothetical protein
MQSSSASESTEPADVLHTGVRAGCGRRRPSVIRHAGTALDFGLHVVALSRHDPGEAIALAAANKLGEHAHAGVVLAELARPGQRAHLRAVSPRRPPGLPVARSFGSAVLQCKRPGPAFSTSREARQECVSESPRPRREYLLSMSRSRSSRAAPRRRPRDRHHLPAGSRRNLTLPASSGTPLR